MSIMPIDPGNPKSLAEGLRQIKRLREGHEREWKLALAFYKGNQYTYYNKRANRIENLPTEDGDKPRYRARLVSNKIERGVQSMLAKLLKNKPVLFATPQSSDDDDIRSSIIAEAVLEHLWEQLHLDDKREEAILWSLIAGNGYWKITWDANAGTPMKFLMNPEGAPVLEPSLQTYFREELTKVGLDPAQFEQTLRMGDVRVDVLSPFQVYLDPSARVFEDAQYVICEHPMSPSLIKSKFGIEVKPDALPRAPDETIPMGLNRTGDHGEMSVKNVYYGYFLPSADLPDGKYVIFIDNPDQILYEDKWNFPTNELPIVRFPGIRVPGQIYDMSPVQQAMPLQKELNRTRSQIVEYKNLFMRPQLLAPAGSIQTRLTNEPGAVIPYNPVGGLKPEPFQMPPLSPYVFEHLRDMNAEIMEAFNVTEVQNGNLPPNLEAGIAIDLLQETATDRLAPLVHGNERALERAGNLILPLVQENYIEPRLIAIKGSSGSVHIEHFSRANFTGGLSVKVETGSGLPRTRAGKQQRIFNMVQMGILPPEKAWKYLDMADMNSLAVKFQQDEDQASREHDKILKREPLNPLAMQNAMQAAMSGMNPATGQPFMDMGEMQMFIQDSALAPNDFDNHGAHADVHSGFMKSVEFEKLPVDIQGQMIAHFNKHIEALQAQASAQQPMVPVRASLQIKSTAGPSATAAILNKSGVAEVTPETMMEPPLDTMVIDNQDKPDAVDSNEAQWQQMQAQREADHAQQLAHKEELHQQTLRQKMAEQVVNLNAKREQADIQRRRASVRPSSSNDSQRKR